MSDQHIILLVEDEVFIAIQEKSELEEKGYHVIHVTNGQDAIQTVLAPDSTIDLVLMDINLNHELDGTQVAEEILKHKDLPIIFLSAHTEPEIVEKTERISSYGYVVKNTGITVLDASIKMAFKLFETKQRANQTAAILQKNNKQFKRILEDSPVIIALVDTNLRYTWIYNPHPDFDAQAVIGKRDDEIVRNDGMLQLMHLKQRVIENGAAAEEEITFPESNGLTTYRVSARPVHNEFGHIIGAKTLAIDITERKQAEKELKRRELLLRTVFEHSRDAIYLLDLQTGRYLFISPSYAKLTGFSIEEMNALSAEETFERIHPDDRTLGIEQQHKIATGEELLTPAEYRWKVKSGEYRWLSDSRKVIRDDQGQAIALVGVRRDITGQKQAEEKLKQSLTEKDLLLKEAYHRIKNHIASIEGMLTLSANSTANREARNILRNTISRVESMRLIYEKLLFHDTYTETSVKDYLDELIASIIRLIPEKTNVRVEKEIADVQLSVKTLFTLGLIVNELVTNALKYAFINQDAGHIQIVLSQKAREITLSIRDNGTGLPEKFNVATSSGLGLSLVTMLTQQLQGTFTMKSEQGTSSMVKFEQ